MESFPEQTKAIVDSGAEIGCHGYAHEGATQLTEAQERDVIKIQTQSGHSEHQSTF
ncbi:hypothetical protein BDV10DRAFT_156058 [Aspergillus recurvatus]